MSTDAQPGYAGRHQQPHEPQPEQDVSYAVPHAYPAAVAYPPMPAPPYGPYGPYGNPLPPATAAALAPGVGAVVGFTLLSGIFGIISAANRAGKARALGLPGTKYWVAFGATLAGVWLFFATLILAVAMAVSGSAAADSSTGTGETVMTAAQLEREVTGTAFTYEDGSPVPTDSVTCTATASVDSRGAGDYTCIVDFTNDATRTYTATVYSDGDWAID